MARSPSRLQPGARRQGRGPARLGALLTLATLAGCSSPPIPLEEDVASSVVRHLGEEFGGDRVAQHGIELRRVRVVAADGAAREDVAVKARRAFERELAASEALRPAPGKAAQGLDLDVELLPVLLDEGEVVKDGAKVTLDLEPPGGERQQLQLTVRREFRGGWREVALSKHQGNE